MVNDQPATQEKPGNDRCFKCNSERVTRGQLLAAEGPPLFSPGRRGFFARLAHPGTLVNEDALACLDCGFVWSSTSAEQLREFIRKHCSRERGKPAEHQRCSRK